ncbi:MAG TPA: DUF1501 domain-containing protein [Cyclobacteriaceae bacterium]
MKRRNFLKKLPVAISVPFTIANIPIKLMADNPLSRLAQQSTNDRVLIILQLHGGNDGLNSLIPIEAYDMYYSKRANIAIPSKKCIPLDSTLPSNAQVGLHPAMQSMKAMYDQGRMTFVQGVSYKNNNGSHFRGRDIWFMGGGADDYYGSGWLGRYLQQEFQPQKYPDDFPNPDMPDPLAIEMGSDVSLIFHQEGNIPASISIDNPARFFELVDTLEGFDDVEIDRRGIPPEALNPSPYWQELNWILQLEDKSEDYAERLYNVYLAGREGTITYPETYPLNAPAGSKRNPLTPQLKLIARLLDGGCKTKVFLVKIGGFDTHAEQVESYDPTMGVHAALMYHISTAMQAFQEDLRQKGLEDRVLTVTTSEFGRRIYSNGSYGTDHGTGGPIFIFGKGVRPGVVGEVPDMNQANVAMQFDYRQVYANLLKDWMLIDQDRITNDIFFGNFIDGPREDGNGFYEPLPLAAQTITGVSDFIGTRFILEGCYPNPAREKTTLHFRTNNNGTVTVELFDNMGARVGELINGVYPPGEHRVEVSLNHLPAGTYVYRMRTGFYREAKKLVIIK